jgi:hypothetical protein
MRNRASSMVSLGNSDLRSRRMRNFVEECLGVPTEKIQCSIAQEFI